MRRRGWLVILAVALVVAASGCRIPVPDGTVSGRTGCEIWWLEPHSPFGTLTPADWFLLGSFVPFPYCTGDAPAP